jgi:hypothetical protein
MPVKFVTTSLSTSGQIQLNEVAAIAKGKECYTNRELAG